MRLIKKVSCAPSSQNYNQFLQKKKIFFPEIARRHSDFIPSKMINEIHEVFYYKDKFSPVRKTYSKISLLETFNESTGTGPVSKEGTASWGLRSGWVVAIVRFKTRYLSSVPMGGIQDPYNIGDHYYGRYADTGYGGRVPEERLMHGQKHDCQHSTTCHVSSGPTSFLLSTNDKYTDGEFRFSRNSNYTHVKLDGELNFEGGEHHFRLFCPLRWFGFRRHVEVDVKCGMMITSIT